MKKCFILAVVVCLAVLAVAQTSRIPMNIFEGTTVVRTAEAKIYHLPNCPEITGPQTFQTNIWSARLWGMEPCKICLYKDQKIVPPEEMPVVGNMYRIASWEGAANKNTETFDVTTQEWKIAWWTRGDSNFILEVYDADSNRRIELAVNIVGNGQDSTIMRSKGRFYLKISTSQDYRVQVFDNR